MSCVGWLLLILAMASGFCRILGGYGMSIEHAGLANDLSNLGYDELFMRSTEKALDDIWARPGVRDALVHLAGDAEAPAQARFLAAEILFYRDAGALTPTIKSGLGAVYADALANDFIPLGNPWGIPGILEGSAAQHAISLGESAVPAFAGLLDNDAEMEYGGSEESTLASDYVLRVNDIAAFIICQITGIPYELKESPEDRDADIESLKDEL
jgi:hypothetical protein